jgi:probable F420-dependent oxidoreductase
VKYTFHLPLDRVQQPEQFLQWNAVQEMVRTLEAAGIDACYVTDHPMPADRWLQTGGHHTLDPFVALSFAAAASKTLRLHTNIVVLPYRNPFITAKMVASLDVLSGGRVILGVGAGYLAEEFDALGVPLDGRGAAMDEALTAMKLAWSGESVKFAGQHFNAVGNTALPQPAQRPHPPIWMGGNSDQAVRRAATHCNGWQPFPVQGGVSVRVRTAPIESPQALHQKILQIEALRQAAGRTDPFDICMVPFGAGMHNTQRPDRNALVDQFRQLAEIGVSWLSVSLPCRDRSEYIENIDWFSREVMSGV